MHHHPTSAFRSPPQAAVKPRLTYHHHKQGHIIPRGKTASATSCDTTLADAGDEYLFSGSTDASSSLFGLTRDRHHKLRPAAAFEALQSRRTGPSVYLPIWYSLPTLEAFRKARAIAGDACTRRRDDFAPMRPGRIATYKYETQEAYYAQYANSMYAITMPKAGLDSMRHYEILASGSVPYFVGSAALTANPLTMYAFPRAAVHAASSLPGVPAEAHVAEALQTDKPLSINYSIFDMPRFCALRAQLIARTERYLTTRTLASYVLEQLRHAVPSALPAGVTPRVLMITSKGVSGDTWQNGSSTMDWCNCLVRASPHTSAERSAVRGLHLSTAFAATAVGTHTLALYILHPSIGNAASRLLIPHYATRCAAASNLATST